MRQDQIRGFVRRAPCARTGLLRAAAAALLLGTAVAAGAPAAHAQTYGGDSGSVWSGLMKMFGGNKSDGGSQINYQERSPLVVPRTRDLPPPVAALAPGPDWPKDAPRSHAHARGKPAIVPGTAVQTPNPSNVSRPWYDPSGIFTREEYAKFTGEPERQRLTDPPAGYRIPSPNEPYGVGPEKKGGISNPTSADMNLTPAGGQAPGH